MSSLAADSPACHQLSGLVRHRLGRFDLADRAYHSAINLVGETTATGRHELPAYATDLLATLSDDRRLQTEDSLKSLLGLLARVPGACTALSQAVVKARTVTGPECLSGLQLQLANFFRLTAPVGLEARSRRQALQLLESSNRS